MEVSNHTPYPAERIFHYDRHGAETLVVAIKGTFDVIDGALAVADVQRPICQSDQYLAEPGNSSVTEACDLLLPKPFTDVFVSGQVEARTGQCRQQDVTVAIGELQRQLLVSGDRKGFGAFSRPDPFDAIALQWEHSWGGTDASANDPQDHEFSASNPIGTGFMAKKSALSESDVSLPNIELKQTAVSARKDRPQPFCTLPIPPYWAPRQQYGGTYDDVWRRSRSPLAPLDFDERFYQAAAPAMVYPGYLQGNESCLLSGINRDRDLAFQLNVIAPQVRVRLANKGSRSKAILETLHAWPNQNQITITWKAAFNVHGRVEQIQHIEMGFTS